MYQTMPDFCRTRSLLSFDHENTHGRPSFTLRGNKLGKVTLAEVRRFVCGPELQSGAY